MSFQLMKKILHVSYSMDTGGGPLTIRRIIEDFPENQYYVSGNRGVHLDYFYKILSPDRMLRLRGWNLPLNLILLVWFSYKNDITILHAHGRGAASFSRFVKLFKPGIKVIYTPNGFFPQSLSVLVRRIYIIGERLLLSLTDVVFFVSESEKRTFASAVKINLPYHKFVYIQNYLKADSPLYKITQPFSNPTTKLIKFIFIGRLSPQKGIDILVEALRLVDRKDFNLTIVGYGEQESFLLNEIEKPDLKDLVTFIGKHNDAFQLMPHFDALLLPSRFEGLPFTLLEAMHYKLIPIVTPCNGNVDIVNSNVGYISDAITAVSFAKSIDQFMYDYLNDKEKITQLKESAYLKLTEEYSLKAVTDKMVKLYQL